MGEDFEFKLHMPKEENEQKPTQDDNNQQKKRPVNMDDDDFNIDESSFETQSNTQNIPEFAIDMPLDEETTSKEEKKEVNSINFDTLDTQQKDDFKINFDTPSAPKEELKQDQENVMPSNEEIVNFKISKEPEVTEDNLFKLKEVDIQAHIERANSTSSEELPLKDVLIFKKTAFENKIIYNILDRFVRSIDTCDNFDEFEVKMKENHYKLLIFDHDLHVDSVNVEEDGIEKLIEQVLSKIDKQLEKTKSHIGGRTKSLIYAINSEHVKKGILGRYDANIQEFIDKNELEKKVRVFV